MVLIRNRKNRTWGERPYVRKVRIFEARASVGDESENIG